MAITRDTLRQLRALTTTVGTEVDDTVRVLTAGWLRAWDELAPAWQAAIGEVVATAAATGRWPSPWELARVDSLASAVVRTEQALTLLAVEAGVTVGGAASTVVAATAAAEPALIVSQLPPALASTVAQAVPQALDVIVRRTTEQITSLTRPLSVEAQEAVRRALIRGVVVGDTPVTAARDMVRRVEGAFNGGLTRAIVIARSEMLDSYRTASRHVHEANADVLSGWMWIATVTGSSARRTCSSCWAMHGKVFNDVAVSGPDDHQQGRCARMPVAKPWRDLGILIEEPASQVPDAQELFAALPRADKLAIMGPSRLALLDSGLVDWGDIPVKRDNPGWRSSYAPRSVRDLQRIAARRRSDAMAK